jgi:hypothetical protein
MKFLDDSKKIHFDEPTHVYSVNGNRCISATQFIEKFQNKFDEDGSILKRKAEQAGISESKLQKQWDDKKNKAGDYGTLFHANIENYINTGKIKKNKYSNIIRHFSDTFKFRGDLFSEVVLFDEELLISGTCDLVQIIDNKIVQCHDFKSNEKPISDFSFGKRMLPPVQHLNDSKLNRYFLQISLYLYLLSTKYGYEIGENNFIFWLNRRKEELQKIPVQLKINEIMLMIAHYSYQKSLAFDA